MRNAFLPRSVFKQATPLLGAAAMGAIALLGMPETAKAFDCGPGPNWVENCPSGVDMFPSIGSIFLDVDLDHEADFKVHLSGPTKIQRGDPFLNGDGLFQIDTEIFSFNLSGELKALNGDPLGLAGRTVTVKVGDGIGNLINDGPLFSSGAIVEQSPGSALADSFFKVFGEFEIEGTPFGPLRNLDPLEPIHLLGDRPLIGIPPGVPGNEVEYNSKPDAKTELFSAGIDGIFGTADDELIAKLVPGPNGEPAESHIPKTPEPSAMLALAGFGSMLGLMKKRNSKKS